MKNLKYVLFPGLIIAGAIILSACNKIPGYGSQSQENGQTQQSNQVQQQSQTEANAITIQDFAYSPSTVKVKAGSTVTITNKDIAGHSVTSDNGTSFDSGIISKDQTKTITAPTKPGTYAFHCTPHPNIKGTLVVE